MSKRPQIIPVAGLLTTMAFAAYMVVQMHGQAAVSADFSNASVAEVRDAQGQVILRGPFALTDEEDDDVERRAVLASDGGAVSGARGEAEIEISRADPSIQEVEFSVEGVPAGSSLSFVIDGAQVASATADDRGRAEVELDVTKPGGVPR